MGLFDTLSKMITGEPVFDAQRDSSPKGAGDTQGMDAQSRDATRTETGHKIEPSIRVSRVKTSRNGNKMVSYAWVQNNSAFAVEVTRFYVGGQSAGMNYLLSASQGKEVKIYDGAVKDNDKDHDAYLDCKITQNGDYFRQHFHVEYNRESDGGYVIEELHSEEVSDI